MVRNRQIDILKGIGAISVIVGHLINHNSILKIFIYSFHMPLFFFLAGYLFNGNNLNFKCYFNKKVKKILIPYFIFNIFALLLNIVLNNDFSLNKFQIIDGIFFLKGNIPWNSSLWFLITIFWCYIIFFVLKKYKIPNYISLTISLLTAVIVSDFHLIFPFGLHLVPMSISFIIIGNICVTKEIKAKKIQSLILLIVFLVFSIYNKLVFISSNTYNNYLIYIIVALSAIYVLFYFSDKIKKNNFLELFGKYSLYIFGTQRILYLIYSKFGIVICSENYKKNFVIILLTIGLYYLLIKIAEKIKERNDYLV